MKKEKQLKKINKIGISGSYGGFNLGDEAILQSIITQINKSVQAEIVVFSQNPEDTLKRHRVKKVVDVRNLNINEVKPEIQGLDLFILGGGGILYDAVVKDYLREVKIAKENNVPVMLYAIGAGPLNDSAAQKMVKETLDQVDIITVRDRQSQRLLESIGVKNEIIVTADPALLIEPEEISEEVIIKENLKRERKLVGISVREPGAAAPDLEEKVYHALMANAADYIVDRLDADVLFIPMEFNKQDLQHSHAVISQMLKPQNASVLKDEYSPGQLLSIIGHFDFALGMRLHFLIFAALQKTPFVALPYAAKVEGFLDELGIKMPPIELVNSGRLIAYIDYFWDKKKSLSTKLYQKLGKIQERAKQTNQLLVDLLKKRYP